MGIDRIELNSSKKILKYHSGATFFYYYIYDELMSSIADKKPDNTALLINKFSSIYNKAEVKNNGLSVANTNKMDLKTSYEQTHSSINFEAKVNDKLVIGLGGHSVYETDITLHHIYGVPYIPASAIKGSFRNWIINKYFKKCAEKCGEKDEKGNKICKNECEQEAMKNSNFLKIFGGTKDKIHYQGQVIFMDSFPIDSYTIKRDVMTPHHKDYYSKNGKEPPLDSDSVTPISFLVVADTIFEFNIFVDNFIKDNIVDDYFELEKETNLKVFIEEEIKDMLNYQGLGGKTSAGYGYFDI